MPNETISILALLFVLVGALYASVGHAGASGYIALMALMGVNTAMMRPTSLTINVLVATIAFVQFARAGHFSWRLTWPFLATSVPAAFLGGTLELPATALRGAIGIALLCAAGRILWITRSTLRDAQQPVQPSVRTCLAIGAAIGLFSGLTGTGGGILLSPVLLLLAWADPKRTAACSACFILVNSAAGLAGLCVDGAEIPEGIAPLVVAAGCGGLVGASIGSRSLNFASLRGVLACVLVIAGVKLTLVG